MRDPSEPLSIAFAVPDLRPGKCGISDYSIRMAALLARRGIVTQILASHSSVAETLIETPEGTVRIGPLNRSTSSSFDILAVQYVPGFNDSHRRFQRDVELTRHPHIHLMVHELWLTDMRNYRLSLRKRIVAARQKQLLKRLIKKWKPASLATSNRHYQAILARSKIEARLSPMLGNIPMTPASGRPGGLKLPSWWPRKPSEFLFVSFGSLYTDYWDSNEMFAQARKLATEKNAAFKWVVVGKIPPSDQAAFQAAAVTAGFGDSIHFTGSLAGDAVDWWLRQANASFSGTPGEIWGKSGGILAAVERRLPLLLPRGWEEGTLETGAVFARNMNEILEIMESNVAGRCSVVQEWRTSEEVLQAFLVLLGPVSQGRLLP